MYKAQLAEMGTHPSLKTVAVKTLKGLEISQCVSIDQQHVPKEIRKLFSKLESKVKFMGSLLRIFMPHFQCVGS